MYDAKNKHTETTIFKNNISELLTSFSNRRSRRFCYFYFSVFLLLNIKISTIKVFCCQSCHGLSENWLSMFL